MGDTNLLTSLKPEIDLIPNSLKFKTLSNLGLNKKEAITSGYVCVTKSKNNLWLSKTDYDNLLILKDKILKYRDFKSKVNLSKIDTLSENKIYISNDIITYNVKFELIIGSLKINDTITYNDDAISYYDDSKNQLDCDKLLQSVELKRQQESNRVTKVLNDFILSLKNKGISEEKAQSLVVTTYKKLKNKSKCKLSAELLRNILTQEIRDCITDSINQKLSQNFDKISKLFPVARGIHRKLTFFAGPTNSGKTYEALNLLAKSESGVYLAPLRLLALEGQEEMEKRNVISSLITGEEQDIKPNAKVICSTIEMLSLTDRIDTAIIDEIQMIGDPDRGWAWVNALLGVPANQIIMTGSEDAIPVIETIAKYLNEELEIKRFTRHNKLNFNSSHTELNSITPGTAIICFSRKDVLNIRNSISKKYSSAIIYGSLGPEVRREEARRFRSGEAEILIATDAIAMGLNLPIENIIFKSDSKFYDMMEHQLSPSLVKQISGRAGRYLQKTTGNIGALSKSVLKNIRHKFYGHNEIIEFPLKFTPNLYHINLLSNLLETKNLLDILVFFKEKLKIEDKLFMSASMNDQILLAEKLDKLNLTLDKKYTLSMAPVDKRSSLVANFFNSISKSISVGEKVILNGIKKYENTHTSDQSELETAEDFVKIRTLYLWLSYRFSDLFTDVSQCRDQIKSLNTYISKSLKSGVKYHCTECKCILPSTHVFPKCENCFKAERINFMDDEDFYFDDEQDTDSQD